MTYFLRRLITIVPVLFIAWTLVFLVLQVIPGDPVNLMLAGRPASGEARENEMDDVLRQIVLAPSDIDLLALDAILARVFAVFDEVGGRAQRADVRSGLRFGEIHRSRPFTAHQLGQIFLLELGRAVMLERFDRADTQHREQVERHIGCSEILEHVAGQREGQALAAKLCRTRDRVPALFDIVLIGCGEAVGQRDNSVLELCALEIANPVQRRPFTRGEFADTTDDGLDHVGLCSGELFRLGKLFDPGVYANGKQLVLGGGGIGHFGSSWLCRARRYSARA